MVQLTTHSSVNNLQRVRAVNHTFLGCIERCLPDCSKSRHSNPAFVLQRSKFICWNIMRITHQHTNYTNSLSTWYDIISTVTLFINLIHWKTVDATNTHLGAWRDRTASGRRGGRAAAENARGARRRHVGDRRRRSAAVWRPEGPSTMKVEAA